MAKKKTFETALQELELIVKKMESGELTLEESLKQYEAGIKHSQFCLKILDSIEKKVTVLNENSQGQFEEKPFEE